MLPYFLFHCCCCCCCHCGIWVCLIRPFLNLLAKRNQKRKKKHWEKMKTIFCWTYKCIVSNFGLYLMQFHLFASTQLKNHWFKEMWGEEIVFTNKSDWSEKIYYTKENELETSQYCGSKSNKCDQIILKLPQYMNTIRKNWKSPKKWIINEPYSIESILSLWD